MVFENLESNSRREDGVGNPLSNHHRHCRTSVALPLISVSVGFASLFVYCGIRIGKTLEFDEIRLSFWLDKSENLGFNEGFWAEVFRN